MAGSMVYRLPAGDIASPHMAAFQEALRQAEGVFDNRGYNYIAGFHGAPGWYCWHHQYNPRTPLQARLFLPWHRAYLWLLELSLQEFVAGVSLPWWDWTTNPDVPSAYVPERIGGQSNPLHSTRAWVPTARPPIDQQTWRAPGSNPWARLPTAGEIATLLADSDYASFHDRLENHHDEVHNWVGGTMRDVLIAAFDPLFFAHHCMIDRIWYLWQVRYGNGGIPRDLLDLPLIPFGKTTRDVLDVQRLGYEYAASSTEVPLAGGGNV